MKIDVYKSFEKIGGKGGKYFMPLDHDSFVASFLQRLAPLHSHPLQNKKKRNDNRPSHLHQKFHVKEIAAMSRSG